MISYLREKYVKLFLNEFLNFKLNIYYFNEFPFLRLFFSLHCWDFPFI